MCGGGGSDDGVKYQRAQERKRQAQIAQGKSTLERLFAPLEGGEYVEDAPYRTMSPDALRARLDEITGLSRQRARGSHDSIGDAITAVLQPHTLVRPELEALGFTPDQITSLDADHYLGLRDAQTTHGMKLNEGVSDPIWQQQTEAYIDFANPQLDRQFTDAREDLAFALSRQGQSAGSVAGERWADLGEDFSLRKQEVADTARGYGNQAKSDIAKQKQSLLTMLSATADSGSTAEAAKSAVASMRSTPGFQPLGPLFQNTTAGLAAGYGGYQQGQAQKRYNQIVYGGDPDRGSGRVVR